MHRKGIPECVLEKMLVLATERGRIHIEGLEKSFYRRGRMTRYRTRGTAIDYSVPLRSLRSRYFTRSQDGQTTRYEPSETFLSKLRDLSIRVYFAEYGAWIEQLLDIWAEKGGQENLVFLSLVSSNHGGALDLAADLELMSKDLSEYVDSNILPVDEQRVTKREVLQQIRSTHAALTTKLTLLKKSSELVASLEKICWRVTGQRILQEARPFRSDCHLWELFGWVADNFRKVAEAVLQWPEDELEKPSLFSTSIQDERVRLLKDIQAAVQSFITATGSDPVSTSANTFEEQIAELVGLARIQLDRWCRAFTGHYDESYFRKNELNESLQVISRCIVYLDIRGSTKILDAVKAEPTLATEHKAWFESIVSIAKNWAILFGGKVSLTKEEAGDKLKAFYEKSSSGLESLALVLSHLDLMDSIQPRQKPFTYRARAGIGESPVMVTAHQEHATVINYLAHAINKLADIDVAGASALALDAFIKEHEEYRKYTVADPVQFDDGKAHCLKYPEICTDVCKRLLSSGLHDTAA